MKTIYKEGDTVFYLDREVLKGIVISTENKGDYPVGVKFPNNDVRYFTADGYYSKHKLPLERLSFTPFEVTLTGATYERPEEDIPKDTLVWVRHKGSAGEWHARYYSHKANGIYYCFIKQLKSAQTKNTGPWTEISFECPL